MVLTWHHCVLKMYWLVICRLLGKSRLLQHHWPDQIMLMIYFYLAPCHQGLRVSLHSGDQTQRLMCIVLMELTMVNWSGCILDVKLWHLRLSSKCMMYFDQSTLWTSSSSENLLDENSSYMKIYCMKINRMEIHHLKIHHQNSSSKFITWKLIAKNSLHENSRHINL